MVLTTLKAAMTVALTIVPMAELIYSQMVLQKVIATAELIAAPVALTVVLMGVPTVQQLVGLMGL